MPTLAKRVAAAHAAAGVRAKRKPLPVCSHLAPEVLTAANTPELKGYSRNWRRCGGGFGSTAPDARKGLVCSCPSEVPGGLLWRQGFECGPRCPGFAPPLDVYCSSGCIGDGVTGYLAACGLAEATGRPVTYRHPQAAWLAGAPHPNVAVIADGRAVGANAFADWPGEVAASERGGGTRAGWYADQVARQLGIPPFAPARPRGIAPLPEPVAGAGYVLLVPFANEENRVWPAAKWRELALLLTADGRRVVATAGHWQAKRLATLFGGMPVELIAGRSPAEAVALIRHADRVAANDSGMAHVAGLYAVPAAVVMTLRPFAWVFGATHPTLRGVGSRGGRLAGVTAAEVFAAV